MKYFTSYFLIVALCATILILPSNSFGFQNEPDSFRGIKWGTNINKLSDMGGGLIQKGYPIKFYIKTNDKMKIGDAELDKIYYHFYKERFFGVQIYFTGFDNFQKLKTTFSQLYGEPTIPNQFVEGYDWLGSNIAIIFKYNEISGKGDILYSYNPLRHEYTKDLEKAAKKGADDL